jgi:hypothetical protein
LAAVGRFSADHLNNGVFSPKLLVLVLDVDSVFAVDSRVNIE